jgi:hypothetical protein
MCFVEFVSTSLNVVVLLLQNVDNLIETDRLEDRRMKDKNADTHLDVQIEVR